MAVERFQPNYYFEKNISASDRLVTDQRSKAENQRSKAVRLSEINMSSTVFGGGCSVRFQSGFEFREAAETVISNPLRSFDSPRPPTDSERSPSL